jgi:hypothetical protein
MDSRVIFGVAGYAESLPFALSPGRHPRAFLGFRTALCIELHLDCTSSRSLELPYRPSNMKIFFPLLTTLASLTYISLASPLAVFELGSRKTVTPGVTYVFLCRRTTI